MRIILAALMTLALAAGCTDSENRIAFDGKFFRVKARKADTRDTFTVTVRDVSRSVEGARLAAHHGAVSYCVGMYGSSEIIWAGASPLDRDAPLRVVDDRLTFAGRCPQAQET